MLARSGLRMNGRRFVLVAMSNDVSFCRVGLSVGRRIGGAVQRNRIKRLLREAFRKNRIPMAVDLLLVAKKDIAGLALADIERELQDRFRRLRQRWSSFTSSHGSSHRH